MKWHAWCFMMHDASKNHFSVNGREINEINPKSSTQYWYLFFHKKCSEEKLLTISSCSSRKNYYTNYYNSWVWSVTEACLKQRKKTMDISYMVPRRKSVAFKFRRNWAIVANWLRCSYPLYPTGFTNTSVRLHWVYQMLRTNFIELLNTAKAVKNIFWNTFWNMVAYKISKWSQ